MSHDPKASSGGHLTFTSNLQSTLMKNKLEETMMTEEQEVPRQAKALSEKSYDSESELDLDAELVELERQEDLQKEREQSKQIKAKPD